ncbi:MAG: tetratricopeptide repeat protein, partial [Aggregatilineales bacterium]
MADNSEHFQQFMEEGHNAAWQHDWVTAAQAYRKACELMPENADARINLGLAYLNSGQLAPALKEYRLATKLTPADPVPLERSADVLERMGKLKDAAQYYVRVADVYLKQRDLTKAIGNWERATQLTPGLVSIHARLAQAYERIGDTKQAIREYLTLAFNFQRMDDVEKGKRAVQRALKMEPNNRQALNTLQALETGGAVTPPTDMRKPRQAVPLDEPADNEPDLFWSPETDVVEISESDPLGPVGEAMSIALELLAAHMVEIGLDPNAMFVLQGMEFQRQSAHSSAINTYKQADAGGLKHPALHLNLGALLLL